MEMELANKTYRSFCLVGQQIFFAANFLWSHFVFFHLNRNYYDNTRQPESNSTFLKSTK